MVLVSQGAHTSMLLLRLVAYAAQHYVLTAPWLAQECFPYISRRLLVDNDPRIQVLALSPRHERCGRAA